jgi:hypothetical protein
VVPDGFAEWTEVMDRWGGMMIAAVETVAAMAEVCLWWAEGGLLRPKPTTSRYLSSLMESGTIARAVFDLLRRVSQAWCGLVLDIAGGFRVGAGRVHVSYASGPSSARAHRCAVSPRPCLRLRPPYHPVGFLLAVMPEGGGAACGNTTHTTQART